MAATTVSAASKNKQLLEDVTECSICKEAYKDPRSLPCVHTYCLKCIDSWSRSKQLGEKVPCPTCRKEFVVPDGGIEALPKNFFINTLLHFKVLTASQNASGPCDVCNCDEETGDERTNSATNYCVQCQQKLCEQCAGHHSRVRATRDHKLVLLGEELTMDDIVTKASTAACSRHPEEQLKLFCTQCKMAICILCFVKFHKNCTDCCDFNEVTNGFKEQMRADCNLMTDGIAKGQDLLGFMRKEYQTLDENARKLEAEIDERADKIIETVERHRQKLLDELRVKNQLRRKQMDHAREEIEQQIMLLEGLIGYTSELEKRGTSTDIARETTTLHTRAGELLNFDLIQRQLDDVGSIELSFTASNVHTGDDENIVGCVDSKISFKDCVTLKHLIPSAGRQVVGITTLDDKLFLSTYNYAVIDVYDTSTFSVVRNVQVPGASIVFGLASCAKTKCVFVAGYNTDAIYKIDLSAEYTVTSWPVPGNPIGVSVDAASSNIMVSCHAAHNLKEYITDGTLVREINLQPIGVTYPLHAIQLCNGNFVISYGSNITSLQGLCIVSANESNTARNIGSYVMPKPTSGQLSGYVAVGSTGNEGYVLVSDCTTGNQRIQVFDRSLNWVRDLSLPQIDNGLQAPFAICLDEMCRRLYVGEWDGQRVVVYDDVRF